MTEPTDIMDKMRITDPIERHRILELMEVITLGLALRGAGGEESIIALNIVLEMLEEAKKAHTFTLTHPLPTRTM